MDETVPGTPPAGHQTPPLRRALYREPESRKIAGVCGGLADHTGLDPVLVRSAAIVLALLVPALIIAYVAAAYLIERRPDSVPRVIAPPVEAVEHLGWLPIAVLAVGAVVAIDARRWWAVDAFAWRPPMPLGAAILLAVGVWLLFRGRDGGWPRSGSTPGDHPSPGTGTHTNPGTDTGSGIGTGTAMGSDAGTGTGWSGSDVGGPGPTLGVHTGPALAGASPGHPGGFPPLTPPAPAGHRPVTGRGERSAALVIPLLLVVAGTAWLVDSADVADVDPRDVLGGGLVVTGVALLAAGRTRYRGALVPVGFLTMGVLLAGEVVTVPLDAGIGSRTVRVDDRTDLAEPLQLTVGELVVDLRYAPLPANRTTHLSAGVGIGRLRVLVPPDANVVTDAVVRVGATSGASGAGSRGDGGLLVDETYTLAGSESGPDLDLDLDVGIGEVVVSRG